MSRACMFSATCALVVVSLALSQLAHADTPPPRRLQVGLELEPARYRHQILHGPFEIRNAGDLAQVEAGRDVERRTRNASDDLRALPAEFGALVSYAFDALVTVGGRITLAYDNPFDSHREHLSVRAGPLGRLALLQTREVGVFAEIALSYQLVHDAFAVPGPGGLDPSAPALTEQITQVGHGAVVLAQLGAHWFLSENISVDPALRAEYDRYVGGSRLDVYAFQVSLLVGMSVWLGDDPISTPARRPAIAPRDQFRPAELPP